MSSSKRVSSITVTEVGTVWLDGFIELHVLRGSDSFGRLALVQLAGELGVVFTAALVVLVLHHEHRVAGVDREGEGQPLQRRKEPGARSRRRPIMTVPLRLVKV